MYTSSPWLIVSATYTASVWSLLVSIPSTGEDYSSFPTSFFNSLKFLSNTICHYGLILFLTLKKNMFSDFIVICILLIVYWLIKYYVYILLEYIQFSHLCVQFNSVQFSRSVVSNCLWPHELCIYYAYCEVKVIQNVRLFSTPYLVHGILQVRILEWVAFPFSRGSSQSRDWTQVSHIAGGFFTSWTTKGAQEYWCG